VRGRDLDLPGQAEREMRKHMDSPTLFARDRAEAEREGGSGFRQALVRANDGNMQLNDSMTSTFSDPGKGPGPSIKCPAIYEALKKKGYSKEKAARISNSKC